MKKALIVFNIMVSFMLGMCVHRIIRLENKIKEVDRTIQFGILTDFGKDSSGLAIWDKVIKEKKVDSLFTWETSSQMMARINKERNKN